MSPMFNKQHNREDFYQDLEGFTQYQIKQMARNLVEDYRQGYIDDSTFKWNVENLLALFLERNLENKISKKLCCFDKKLFKINNSEAC